MRCAGWLIGSWLRAPMCTPFWLHAAASWCSSGTSRVPTRSTPAGWKASPLTPIHCITHKVGFEDRRVRTVLRRAILPPTAAPQHMQDAADHPPIVRPFLAAHVGRQMRLDLLPLMVVKPE